MSVETREKCNRCGGKGWIHRRDESGYESTIPCTCYETLLRTQRYAQAGIPKRYESCSINSLDLMDNRDLKNAKERAHEFVYPYLDDVRGLLFMGPPGVGKTHLAVGILKYLIEEKKVIARFEEFRSLLQEIRDSYDPNSGAREKDILRPAMESDILLLDDLGAEKPTGWVLDTLMLIIDYRYNNKLMTLVTTNYLDDPRLMKQVGSITFGTQRNEGTLSDRIGSRLRSRLHEMCDTVIILGEDYRKQADKGSRRQSTSGRQFRSL